MVMHGGGRRYRYLSSLPLLLLLNGRQRRASWPSKSPAKTLFPHTISPPFSPTCLFSRHFATNLLLALALGSGEPWWCRNNNIIIMVLPCPHHHQAPAPARPAAINPSSSYPHHPLYLLHPETETFCLASSSMYCYLAFKIHTVLSSNLLWVRLVLVLLAAAAPPPPPPPAGAPAAPLDTPPAPGAHSATPNAAPAGG